MRNKIEQGTFSAIQSGFTVGTALKTALMADYKQRQQEMKLPTKTIVAIMKLNGEESVQVGTITESGFVRLKYWSGQLSTIARQVNQSEGWELVRIYKETPGCVIYDKNREDNGNQI